MVVLNIEAGRGIGDVKLGMTKEEVIQSILKYEAEYHRPEHMKNYFKNSFKVKYDSEGKVKLIEIPSELKEDFQCMFMNIDVFNTKAEKLVALLDEISKYDRDDTELDTCFTFPELGLILWRPDVLKEEDLEKEWFKELKPSIQEDTKKNLYFSSVAIIPRPSHSEH
ncbi:hypothetical protein [Brevibacillus invocatus]|uniref:hypothetical protein n=1 Tax=Brevibacillus invocatus TaxID=173959 RepID=UPI00203C5627|nr:hypothetical protein [Brevibacillus invocatus]MCM3080221.1 hypothetical protein [Brevibacillus invocatus]MCM3430333.1 hypothetical protein [Brevibacillus invocatus]